MNIEYFECCSRKRVLMLKVLCLETTRGVNESLPLSSNTQKREGEGLKKTRGVNESLGPFLSSSSSGKKSRQVIK